MTALSHANVASQELTELPVLLARARVCNVLNGAQRLNGLTDLNAFKCYSALKFRTARSVNVTKHAHEHGFFLYLEEFAARTDSNLRSIRFGRQLKTGLYCVFLRPRPFERASTFNVLNGSNRINGLNTPTEPEPVSRPSLLAHPQACSRRDLPRQVRERRPAYHDRSLA
jgi:hypothetical protein